MGVQHGEGRRLAQPARAAATPAARAWCNRRNCRHGRRGGSSRRPRHLLQRPARPRCDMSSPSARPSRSRSIPAQATITALSPHSRIGRRHKRQVSVRFGHRSQRPPNRRHSPPRRPRPPSATRLRHRGQACRARSAITSATAAWKPAATSAASCRAKAPGGNFATTCATAVFSPENEKSHPARPRNGRGNAQRVASPGSASRSTWGPPGQGRPSSLPTLSNASPTASSMVPPNRR